MGPGPRERRPAAGGNGELILRRQPITQADFEKAASADLRQLEREYTQARRTLLGKHAEEVKQDLVAGSAAGVGGTPAMFVNGRFLAEEMTFETISKMVDDEFQRREKAGTKS